MCLKIIFVEARTHFDVLLLKLKLKAIQYKRLELCHSLLSLVGRCVRYSVHFLCHINLLVAPLSFRLRIKLVYCPFSALFSFRYLA